MIQQSVSLASNGVVKVPGYEHLVRFGYTKNRGVYRLTVTATGEWEGLTIRAFWHLPGGTAPESSLVVDGYVDVPASVTAQPGDGCITFEGSDGTKTVTSADLHYRVNANSGTEDGTMPEPGTPAWEQLVGVVRDNADKAEQASTDAQAAAEQSVASAKKAGQALSGTIAAKEDALKAIGDKQTAATQAVDTARDDALEQVKASTEAAQTAASEAATNADSADQSAQEAANSLQELKDGIANGDFKGEDGLNAPQIDDTTVTDSSPWSSKHIVDMLCPPLEETGNPVQCYPVAGYPLGCKVSWEPTQEGAGDPSPDNIRPIKGRDSVTVERCGENLLKFSKQSYKFTQFAGPLASNLKAGSYYLSCGNVVHEGKKDPVIAFVDENLITRNYLRRGTKEKVELERDCTDIYLYANNYDFNGSAGITATVEDLMLVPGTTPPAAYTPYTGQTATLTLPTTIYGGTVDAVTGEGQETWKLVTLDGTETWETWGVNKNNAAVTGFYTYGINDYDPSSDKILCSALPHRNVDVWGGRNEGIGFATTLDQSRRYIIYSVKTAMLSDTSDDKSSVASLKSYLAAQYAAGTPVQIAYKLAEPVPFTVTGAQPIPALSGVNTVLTDADSATVTGRADPIKRIIDLEDAVASMT